MLAINLYNDDKHILIIKIKGHCSNNHGKDLLCAAFSAIVTGFCNFLIVKENANDNKDIKIKLEDGYCIIKFVKLNNKIKNCLELFWQQLLTLAKDNQNKIIMKGDLYEFI